MTVKFEGQIQEDQTSTQNLEVLTWLVCYSWNEVAGTARMFYNGTDNKQ